MAADGINIRIRWSNTEPDSTDSSVQPTMYITNHTIPFGGPLPPGLQEPPLDYPYFESMEFELVDTEEAYSYKLGEVVEVLNHDGYVGYTGVVVAKYSSSDAPDHLTVETDDTELHHVVVGRDSVRLKA